MLVVYFVGLLTYHQSLASFIYNRQSGVPFELMSSFNFTKDNSWQVSCFFRQHGVAYKEITLYGAGLPIVRPDFQGGGLPIGVNALWYDSIQDNLTAMERQVGWRNPAIPKFVETVQWDRGAPSTGHVALTRIGTRTETISPLSFGLMWTDAQGAPRYTHTEKLVFTTDIYSIQNIWLLYHSLNPPDPDPQFVSFLNSEKERFLRNAENYQAGKVDTAILFYGLPELPRLLASGKGGIVEAALWGLFVGLPTLPIKWMLFAPLFMVPHTLIGVVAWMYFYFLVLLGVAASFLCVRAWRKR